MSNCIFESRTDISSATICKHCGKEKFEHTMNNLEVTMSKQTAVDFLVSLLNKEGFAPVLTDKEIQQAKQMEKEQMIDAILDNRNITSQVTLKDAEQYYNELYGGEDEH